MRGEGTGCVSVPSGAEEVEVDAIEEPTAAKEPRLIHLPVEGITFDAQLSTRCGRKIKCHPNYRTLQRSNSCKNPFKTMTYFNSAICKRFVGMEAGIIKVSS